MRHTIGTDHTNVTESNQTLVNQIVRYCFCYGGENYSKCQQMERGNDQATRTTLMKVMRKVCQKVTNNKNVYALLEFMHNLAGLI
ncbi:hypothetical protein EG68_10506 [Paragonimus skrjabini miyazakii]|uniref:Uncharacterized protein n=1 Tax=Paragonimus skrjabini miyazakii TaxID=59628 RepID=A0A8S9YGK6_9TREM|nr:hypothetical protein EG68_10506 [Paragonimus skrjabini miyazakii]